MPRRLAAVALAVMIASLVGTAAAATASTARIAWFYKPPTDGSSAAAIASATTGQMILTKRDEAFRDQLRAAGYGGSILQYVEAAYVHGPSGVVTGASVCDASFAPWGNNVAWNQGDFCRHLHPNEDWFLHNGRGERLVGGYSTGGYGAYYAMNPANPGWRQFYAARVRQALHGDAGTKALGYHGVFLDDVWLTRHQLLNRAANADGAVRELGSDAELRAGVVGLLQAVRAAAGGRPVHANTDGNDFYLPYLDGTMREDFGASWGGAYMNASAVAGVWSSADRAASAGKGLVLVGQGPREDLDRMRFAFAAYLMVAGPTVSFRYARDGEAYRHLWGFDDYHLDIGSPDGSRSLVAGSTWRRQFEGGVAAVNLSATSPQALDLGGVHVAADGSLHSMLVLPPRTGAVLRRLDGGPAETLAATAPPIVSGVPAIGATLNATAGSWSAAPSSLAYAWLRCDAGGGSCTAIAKATLPAYDVSRRDVGSTIRVRVTARAGRLVAQAESAVTKIVTVGRADRRSAARARR